MPQLDKVLFASEVNFVLLYMFFFLLINVSFVRLSKYFRFIRYFFYKNKFTPSFSLLKSSFTINKIFDQIFIEIFTLNFKQITDDLFVSVSILSQWSKNLCEILILNNFKNFQLFFITFSPIKLNNLLLVFSRYFVLSKNFQSSSLVNTEITNFFNEKTIDNSLLNLNVTKNLHNVEHFLLSFIGLFFVNDIVFSLLSMIQIILQILFLLGAIAMFTLGERKLMAAVQRRKGPNTSLPYGIGQPIADGFKLLLKEVILPKRANIWLFFIAPFITFILSLWHWIVLPFTVYFQVVNLNFAILYTLAISSLSVYGLIIAGWSSNSKYAFLGSIRAAAQMISYEISLGFIILTILLLSGSLNYATLTLLQKAVWFFFPLFPCFFLFCVIMLAETNRTPFDLAEAEAELVAGYNVEYSSITFAFFFLGEYSNMMVMSSLVVLFFFGGWLPLVGNGPGSIFYFIFKILFFCIFFVWVRATLPRYRYDQLMVIGWKFVLPFTMAFFLFITGIFIIYFNMVSNQQLGVYNIDTFYTYFFLKPFSVS